MCGFIVNEEIEMNDIETSSNATLDETVDTLLTKPTITENTTEDITANTTSELENTQQEPSANKSVGYIPVGRHTDEFHKAHTTGRDTWESIIRSIRADARDLERDIQQRTKELKTDPEPIKQQQKIAEEYQSSSKSKPLKEYEEVNYTTTRDPNDMVFTSYYEEPKPIEEVITIQADKTHLIGFHIGIIIAVVISLFFIKDTYFLQPFVLAIISASSILLAYYMLGDLGMFLTIMVISLYWFIMFMTNRMDFLNTFDDYDYIQKS